MARMLPPRVARTAPAGERLLFNWLLADPACRDWIVFHSVHVRRHLLKIEGEIDMIIAVPGLGILCVEVKGSDVSRRRGLWIYPYGEREESPFRQASVAMHSLRRYLASKDPALGSVLFFSAVLFTTIDFAEQSPEWHPWQAIGRSQLLRAPISQTVEGILNKAHEHIRAHRTAGWYDSVRSRPGVRLLSRLVAVLRSDFEYADSGRGEVEHMETEIRRFTEEQFDALDQLSENPRVLFKGPAGTGKTFLALEVARRAVSRGRSVALVCFNALLGEWIEQAFEECSVLARSSGTKFYAGTLHRLMLRISGLEVPEGADSEFWRSRLPNAAIDSMLSDTRREDGFDLLVVDEVQDLVFSSYLDVMDLALGGGLAGGEWAMFGDFEHQAIYIRPNGDGIDLSRAITSRSPSHTTFALRINCRNSESIAETLAITTGMSPGYKRVLNMQPAPDVEPRFYRSQEDQRDALRGMVNLLLRRHAPRDIVVLSMNPDATACMSAIASIAGLPTVPYSIADAEAAIRYASIRTFKGMEAPAVIVTDIERIDEEAAKALLYVGMSRARVQLLMLMHERVRPAYDRLLTSGLRVALGRR